MSQRIPASIWLVTLLAAVVLGIWPGVMMELPNYAWVAALGGWLLLLLSLYHLLMGNFSTMWQMWFIWLISSYPLAMLGYSACAYWTVRRTGVIYKGLIVAGVAACVSTLVSILATMITWSINQGLPLRSFFGSYLLSRPPVHGIILIHLLISAVLGWLIGTVLARSTPS